MRSGYKNYLLTLLMVVLAFNVLDRMVLSIVLQDVKTDLGLTDTQLGLLTGIAFALFYSVMGIPIARWADRGNRVTIVTITTALWSVATALCGMATSFAQLLLIRVAVAVGEAGCIPSAHSLISDTFSRAERPRAFARYMLGLPLALTAGYFVTGWLNELFGWRATFLIVGSPGLVLAILAYLTLKEPRLLQVKAAAMPQEPAPPSQPSLKEVCTTLWTNKTYRYLLICFSVWYFFAQGLSQWTPAFFIRSHGLQTGQLGTWLAMAYTVGAISTYLGGEWAVRYAAHNERLQLVACAVAFAFFPIANICTYLAPTYPLAFGAMALAALAGMAQGPIFATIQTLAPPRMRAMSIALTYLFANLIGMGLGPLAAGALSDLLAPRYAEESLRYALILLCPGYFVASWLLWRASRTVRRDLPRPEPESDTDTDEEKLCVTLKSSNT